MGPDRYTGQLQREGLRIVVLGPGHAQPNDYSKRKQITCRLRGHGYSLAKLGEEFLGEPNLPMHLALLSGLPEIDLLVVLNSGVAPLVELTAISTDHRAIPITRVWSKREYAQERRSTPRDVMEMFDNWLFSEEEFESCELVASVIETADRFCTSKAQREGRLTALRLPPPGSA